MSLPRFSYDFSSELSTRSIMQRIVQEWEQSRNDHSVSHLEVLTGVFVREEPSSGLSEGECDLYSPGDRS